MSRSVYGFLRRDFAMLWVTKF